MVSPVETHLLTDITYIQTHKGRNVTSLAIVIKLSNTAVRLSDSVRRDIDIDMFKLLNSAVISGRALDQCMCPSDTRDHPDSMVVDWTGLGNPS